MTDTKLEPELPQEVPHDVAAAFFRERDKLNIIKDGTVAHLIAVGAVKDALSAIEADRNKRALLSSVAPRVPEWISVDERLPTHIYSVLGYVTEGPLTVGGTSPMRDIVSYCPDRDVWLQHVDGDDVVVSVSHWQDLPAAPQPTQEG